MNFLDNPDPSTTTNRELSDWRNIELNQPTTVFDHIWTPTTVNPWNTPVGQNAFSINPVPSHPYPWTNMNNHRPAWPLPNYPTFLPNFINSNQPMAPPDIIDLTLNAPILTNDPINAPIISSDNNGLQTTEINVNPAATVEVDVEEILGQVEAVIPDIDIDAARRTITNMNPIPRLDDIISNFLDNGYKKRQKKSSSSENDRKLSLKRSWSETIDDIPKFLNSYSDPITYFFDTKRKQSESYVNHAKAFLLRAFPTIDKEILEKILQEENYHFLPAVRKVESQFRLRTNSFLQRSTIRRSLDMMDYPTTVGTLTRTPSASWLIRNNKFAYAIPHTPCEEFYDELRYAKNEVKIRRYLCKVSREHDKRVKKAKKGNETLECEICCQDDFLVDDMIECTVGHLHCRSCIRSHVDVCFQEGKCQFPCVEISCPGEYTMRVVTKLLPPKDVERLNRRIQEENIRQAEIDGLECCPYCPYAVIVDNPDDKVFRCLNPECMRETCRLCKEPNHIPLRCDEIEKGVELEMRKFIEEHVTEAMIRRCPRCNQKFYKVEGCNKMTCSSCGLYICYVCRQTITGYDHFTNNEKCTLSNQSEKLHYDEMVQAYANAKAEYLRLHPDAHDMVLRYDPIGHLSKPVPTANPTN